MKLLIFCHSKVAYMLPNNLFEKIKKADRDYENGDIEARKLIDEIKLKYKPIEIGHLLTGDIG